MPSGEEEEEEEEEEGEEEDWQVCRIWRALEFFSIFLLVLFSFVTLNRIGSRTDIRIPRIQSQRPAAAILLAIFLTVSTRRDGDGLLREWWG